MINQQLTTTNIIKAIISHFYNHLIACMNHHQLSTIIILSINVNHLHDHAWPSIIMSIGNHCNCYQASFSIDNHHPNQFEAFRSVIFGDDHDRPLYRPLQMNCFIPSLAIINCCLIYHHYKWSLTIIDHYKWSSTVSFMNELSFIPSSTAAWSTM